MIKLIVVLSVMFIGFRAEQVVPGVIEGRVTQSGSSEPISDVHITLAGPATAPINVSTDRTGKFRIENILAGRYTLRAEREGYFGHSLNGASTPFASATVNIDATIVPSTATVSLFMTRGAIVSGRILNLDGQASAAITVTAFRAEYRELHEVLVAAATNATDDRGEYRLFWLPPGKYYIAATPRRANRTSSPRDSWIRTYFPGTTDSRQAYPLEVTAGAELGGIDIKTQPAPTVSLSGIVRNAVVDEGGNLGSPAIGFYLIPSEADALVGSTFAMLPNLAGNRTNGQFELHGISPGSYDLIAVVRNQQNALFPGTLSIVVGDQNRGDLLVSILPGIDVKAVIVREQGALGQALLKNVRVRLSSKEIVHTLFDGVLAASAAGRSATVRSGPEPRIPFLQDDASFLFSGMPEGRYSVTVTGLPPNAYVADMRMAGRTVFDEGIRVRHEALPPIEIMISAAGGTVRGTIQPTEQAHAALRVVLVPDPARRQNTTLYKTTMTNTDGSFLLTAIAPGMYKLFVWDSLQGTEYMNGQFLKKYEHQGQEVVISPGSSVMVSVGVIHEKAPQ